jgi:hypothetical protein
VGLYEARVSANSDGTLTLERPGADPLRLASVGPLRFDEVDGPRRVAFRERDGRVTDLFVGPIAWERVPFLATRSATLAIQGVCLALLLSWLLAWPWRAAARRRARRAAALDPAARAPEAMLRGAGAAAALAAAAWLGWGIGATLVLADLNLFDLVRGVPPSLRRLLALPVLGALLTGPVAVFAGLALWRRAATPGVRAHYALVAGAAVALTLCAIQWNWLVPGV